MSVGRTVDTKVGRGESSVVSPTSEADFTATEATFTSAQARVRIVKYNWIGPFEATLTPTTYRLDLSLNPRQKAGGCRFVQHWPSHQFEALGRLVLTPPDEPIECRGDGADHSSIVFECQPEAMHALLGCDDIEQNRAVLRSCLDMHCMDIVQTLHSLKRELTYPGLASETLCELLCDQVAIYLRRHLTGIQDHVRGGLSAWRMRIIDEAIEDLDHIPDLKTISDLCGLSVRQLSRAFKASKGYSIGKYFEDKRLRKAKGFLYSGRSVKETAHLLGFRSPANFATAFRRAAGETPTEFAQRIRARIASGIDEALLRTTDAHSGEADGRHSRH